MPSGSTKGLRGEPRGWVGLRVLLVVIVGREGEKGCGRRGEGEGCGGGYGVVSGDVFFQARIVIHCMYQVLIYFTIRKCVKQHSL